MGFRTKLINALGGVEKTNNKIIPGTTRNEFLKYGSRGNALTPTWADIQMPDEDLYRGYSYAVIQKRGNKVASLARENLRTWAKPEIVDEYQKRNESPLHPYLKVIEDSVKFTEKQFWKNISIYLDLAGRYYLGVVRDYRESSVASLPAITSDIKEFIMLNPYEIRRVVDKDGNLAGYVERKKDGRYREWPVHQIIEMRELNPFDGDKVWSMTSAAREAVYTINQSGDYTRQTLNGNLDAPGILTTDVILEDTEFANFQERVRQHRKGEPIFGNGSGAIQWNPMQIDLDKSALADINEINRTTLFAVSGTSKTSLGIEQSGTTRETARVQSEQFVSDTAQPRLEDIVDFLNLDYKQHYKKEYDKTGYTIEIASAVSQDYDTMSKATATRQEQFNLAQSLIQSGYTKESASQYALGEIELSDLEAGPNFVPPEEQGGEDENPTEGGTPDEPDKPTGGQDNSPRFDLLEDLEQFDNQTPHGHSDTCSCHNEFSLDDYKEKIEEKDSKKILTNAYKNLLKEVRTVQREAIQMSSENVSINAFTIDDLFTDEQKEMLFRKLKNAFSKYWKILLPLFGNSLTQKRNKQFNADHQYKFTNEMGDAVDENANTVAQSHVQTIGNDILEASNQAYTKVVEDAAAKLIVKAYKQNPDKWSKWFDSLPTENEALKAIHDTTIIEENKKLYDKANEMAWKGYDRQTIIKAIKNEYKELSTKRAELIVTNETSRAYAHSQYYADLQFLNSIGKLDVAYKELYSRSGNPCEYCQELINRGPIPFTQNFLDKGESITVTENGKVKTFTANYENIASGIVHPRCYARDTELYTNEGWKRVDELTGNELFWSIDPETKKPEWVKAKKLVKTYAETLLRFHNKNVDMAVTKDHNMLMYVPHRVGDNKLGKREYTLELVEAENVKRKYGFYGGVEWEGQTPETVKIGKYDVPAKLYARFMGYYLSEGSANYYEYKNAYQMGIAQETHHNKFWKDLKQMPFKMWNGKNDFTTSDKSVVEYCMQFGKSHEKYIPQEIKDLSPELLKEFLDAFVLGDGNRKYVAKTNSWATTVTTSSVRLRDDLMEVIQKAGYRPTVRLDKPKGSIYPHTNYKSNHDVWRISICNKTASWCQTVKTTEIEYHDDVFCVELEKNHTLWVMYNGKCWWSGNCHCDYRLIIRENGLEGEKVLNGGKGSGNLGHLGG